MEPVCPRCRFRYTLGTQERPLERLQIGVCPYIPRDPCFIYPPIRRVDILFGFAGGLPW